MVFGRSGSQSDSERGGRESRWTGSGPAIVLLVCGLILSSCALAGKSNTADTATAPQKPEKIQDAEPQPGAVKMIDGVEYVYAKNVRWPTLASEPQYVWVRKDQYSPGPFESMKQSSAAEEKELGELKKRIERLETELGKTDRAQ
jgi:hypothetical protein